MVRKDKRRKEEIAEDWCFVCKDGGLLMVCDYRDCLKAYHPHCVDKDDSILENGSKWTCDLHFCALCHKASKFKCFCCPKAVCGNCLYDAEFATVKPNKGFCRHCSKLALLIEENADVDSDGEKVDFKDKDTYECLFSEYYEIIKEEEGLNSQHVYSAHRFFKNGKNKRDLDPDEIGEGEDDTSDSGDMSNFIVSDSDDLNDTARSKSARKKKGMKKLKSMNGKVKDKKKEFIGWGSRSLIEFLKYIAIVGSNLKLVYLKRSLVDEISKQPETFDGKVLGSYVRVKSDPYDYLQKNSHLLVQVVGINRSLKNDEINKEIMLQLSNLPKDVPICKISDDDFSEEECQDLYQRMRNGLLKQPTIVELEQKARSLREDIIKHWIPRELVLLQNRIDQANEKGWRREYPFMMYISDCCLRLVAKGQSVMNCYPIYCLIKHINILIT
uniref:Uncharacterized protein At5g08430 n=1 Tax=Cajanus cajan TaxID=3821 RepID=A0A151UA03_CAJCA|nr:Uncharacterized protein At5g08430 [Cajanus cajan]